MGNGDTIITYHKGKSLKDLLEDPKLQGTIENSRSCVIWAPLGRVLVDSIGCYLVKMSTAISADSQLPYQLTVGWYISWCISWHLGGHVGQHLTECQPTYWPICWLSIGFRKYTSQHSVNTVSIVGGISVDCWWKIGWLLYDKICVNQKGRSGAREGKDRTHTLKI